MTVENLPTVEPPTSVASGVNTYTFNFDVYDEAHVQVQVTDPDGTVTDLTYATDYTVALTPSPGTGGTVTVSASLTLNAQVVVYRVTPPLQGTSLPNEGPFFGEDVEKELDRQTMISQEQARDAARSILLALTDTGETPTVRSRAANKLLVWDENGVHIIEGPSKADIDNSVTAAQAAQTGAETAQGLAEAARDSALEAYDNFDDRYLGAHASDPLVDNDGDPLVGGALYYNTTDNVVKLYIGTGWVAAYVNGGDVLLKINNLGDLPDPAAARGNLGLGNVDNTSDADKPVSTATQTALNLKADAAGNATLSDLGKVPALGTEAGTTYNLVNGDAGELIQFTNASAITLTIQANATEAYDDRFQCEVLQLGAGALLIDAASGVTIYFSDGTTITGSSPKQIANQYAGVSIVRLSSDTWWVVGAFA